MSSQAPLRRFTCHATLSIFVLAFGCGHAAKVTPPAGDQAIVLSDERIGVDDVVHILVVGEKDLTEDFRVADDGTIDYPFVGRVVVAGLRSGELQSLIATRL